MTLEQESLMLHDVIYDLLHSWEKEQTDTQKTLINSLKARCWEIKKKRE